MGDVLVDDARQRARTAILNEFNLRVSGVAEREITAGRAGQLGGVEAGIAGGVERGLTSEEIVRAAQAGARVEEGRLRQTLTPALDVTDAQRNILRDDLLLALGDDPGKFLQASRALDEVLNGSVNLQPAQIRVLGELFEHLERARFHGCSRADRFVPQPGKIDELLVREIVAHAVAEPADQVQRIEIPPAQMAEEVIPPHGPELSAMVASERGKRMTELTKVVVGQARAFLELPVDVHVAKVQERIAQIEQNAAHRLTHGISHGKRP